MTYPYYRFFNTTLSWVMLVGLGGYFLIRFVGGRLEGRGTAGVAVTMVVAVAVGAVFALNFAKGFDSAGWNDPDKGWLSDAERTTLDAVRAQLLVAAGSEQSEGGPVLVDQVIEKDQPVVFVIDSETEGFQVWGETKLAGNTSRFGLPHGLIDQGYLYLGDLRNFLIDEPTFVGDGEQPTEECDTDTLGENTYNCLSFALLEDTRAGIEKAGTKPIVVVADIFNATGSNTSVVEAEPGTTTFELGPDAPEVWVVQGDTVAVSGSDVSQVSIDEADPGWAHILRVCCSALRFSLLPGSSR